MHRLRVSSIGALLLRCGIAIASVISIGLPGMSAAAPPEDPDQLPRCPGAMPTLKNPYQKQLLGMKDRALDPASQCEYERTVRLMHNFQLCSGTVLIGSVAGDRYAQQQAHIRRYGKPSTALTKEAAEEDMISATLRGTYTGDLIQTAIDMGYGGQSSQSIQENLFCQCLLDTHDYEYRSNPDKLVRPVGC